MYKPHELSIFKNDFAFEYLEVFDFSVGQNGAPVLGNSSFGQKPLYAVINGTVGDDVLNGTVNGDSIRGHEGNDEINGLAGRDYLYGGAGNDVLNGGDGDDSLNYEVGGNDILNGGAGNDFLRIANRQDSTVPTITANGNEGNDRLIHIDNAQTNIIFNGGIGNDRTQVWFGHIASNYTFDMGDGDDIVEIGNATSGGHGNYDITLGFGSDRILLKNIPTSLNVADFEVGGSGDIIIFDLAGEMQNWNGVDNLFSTGHISLVQEGSHTIVKLDMDGSGGNSDIIDLIIIENTQLGDLVAHNFNGFASDGSAPVPAMVTGDGTIYGFAGNDTITGGDGRDTIFGYSGNDTLNGGGGADSLYGGTGADILNGGGNADNLYGGAGTDILNGGDGNDTLYYEVGGNDTLNGGTGNDLIRISNRLTNPVPIVTVNGNGGDDRLIHIDNAQTNIIFHGGIGNDLAQIWFGHAASNYTFDMGDGDDIVEVGNGNTKGKGQYTLTLGNGSDIVDVQNIGITPNNITLPLPTKIDILDFQVGVSGDIFRLNFADNMEGWDGITNPFTTGYIRLIQHRDEVELQVRITNAILNFDQWTSLATFWSIRADDFASVNLGGYSPLQGVNYQGDNEVDIYTATQFDDVIDTFGGDDIVHGAGGNDTISGGLGSDDLFGDAGDDTLNGGDGDDDLNGGEGADVLNGGAGRDRLFYNFATSGVTVNLFNAALNTGEAAGDTYSSIESLNGSNFDDSLTSGNDNNDLVGLNGNDVLIGAGGRDRLFGGNGDDRLLGGTGNDDLNGAAGIDTYVIQAGAGTDRIFTFEAGIDVIEMNGGAASFADLTITQVGANTEIAHVNGVTVLMGITAGTVTAGDFTFINPLPAPTGVDVTTNLTSGDDSFTGDENNDIVNGLAGNDIIRGGIGDDTLNGGDGNDQLTGGLGADILDGGAGIDRVVYSSASTGVTVNAINSALNTGEAAGDTYISIENFYGSAYDDHITSGSDGNDLVGLDGDDTLIGAGGNDRLFGGNDNDRLLGGTGNDDMHGQGGNDTYVIQANAGSDRIFGFEDGLDIIEMRDGPADFAALTITQVGANTAVTSVNGTLTLMAFTATDLDASDFTFFNPAAEAPTAPKGSAAQEEAGTDVKVEETLDTATAQDVIAEFLTQSPLMRSPLIYTDVDGIFAMAPDMDSKAGYDFFEALNLF